MMLRTLILAAVVIACAQPAFAQLAMGPDAIGPIKRGWTISDILVSGMPYEHEVVPTEGDPVTIYRVTVDSQIRVELWFWSDDTPYRLATGSQAFTTREGAHVGDTVATLQRLYPKGRVFKTAEEGGLMSFLPFGLGSGAEPVLAFAFDFSALSDDCLIFDRGCPDLSAMRSNGFAVTWLK